MNAREPHRVVSVNVTQSSWPLVERLWLRAAKGVLDAAVFTSGERIAAQVTNSIVKLGARQPLATAACA